MKVLGTADFARTYDAAIVAAIGIAQKEVIRRGVQYVCFPFMLANSERKD
jgi:hypothetical protein